MAARLSRRGFLAGSASIVAALAALQSRRAAASRASRSVTGPYGRLRPTADLETGLPLLLLPEGFSYRSFSWTGDPMANGEPAPDSHDGMGVIASRGEGESLEVMLVRNHERALGIPIRAPARYDAAELSGSGVAPAGGTTTLKFRGRRWVSAEPSLGGTIFNCAGGVTPWGSWLSGEETLMDLTAKGGRRHGYLFEVRSDAAKTTGAPLTAMGRFRHEAVAIDPRTNFAYMTEDEIDARCSGFYRFLPREASGTAGSYEAGGRLQAAKVAGLRNADLRAPAIGDEYAIEWVDIAKPDADPGPAPVTLDAPRVASGPFLQAWQRGALWISRGEGCCHHDGRIYFVDTIAGRDTLGRAGQGDGAVWELDPAAGRLRAAFVADSQIVGDNIDNVTVSPRGGMLLCEDGDPVTDGYGPGTRLLGVTRAGDSYPLAKNNLELLGGQLAAAGKRVPPRDYRGEEWAGCCFDAKGEVLFVNIQIPGITFAIWGPWERGNL
jgi:secreted PhoX family phosphatase